MDITIFLLNDGDSLPISTHKSDAYYKPDVILQKEIEEYEISAKIVTMDTDDYFPSKIDSSLALIVDQSLMLKADTINHLISLNNMFRMAGIFCGPIYQKVKAKTMSSSYASSFHNYDLDFGASEVCDISKEINNYPSLIGCCVTKEAYNRFNINPVYSGRSKSRDNKIFISQVASRYGVFYSKGFSKLKHLTAKDVEISAVSDYYYNLGYQDGCLLVNKKENEKRIELWRRFVSSPEMLDNDLPRWLFRLTPEDGSEHLEELVLIKCKYQIGFYEGMLGKNVL